MPDFGNNHFTQSPFVGSEGVTSAPPPPSEVRVRTLRSDLASMAKSGGGLPRFQNVKVKGLSMEKRAEVTQASSNPAAAKAKRNATLVLAIIAGVAALGAIGYFAYQLFFNHGAGIQLPPSGSGQNAVTPATSSANGTQANGGTIIAPTSTAPFVHATLFKRLADQTLILKLPLAGGTTTSTVDLQTFNQKLGTLLATANKNSNMIEVEVTTSDGHSMPVGDIFAQANTQVMDPALLSAHFNADATFFAYRDKGSLWPGYVLSLKPGENWLFSKVDTAKIESSASIANFFLANVGSPFKAGFVDNTVSSTAVRELPFSGTATPGVFVYGWYKTYFVISTSEKGFAEAIGRL